MPETVKFPPNVESMLAMLGKRHRWLVYSDPKVIRSVDVYYDGTGEWCPVCVAVIDRVDPGVELDFRIDNELALTGVYDKFVGLSSDERELVTSVADGERSESWTNEMCRLLGIEVGNGES